MLDELPELLPVGDPAEKPDGNAEAALVAAPAAEGPTFVVEPERLLEPRRRVDARRMRTERPFDVLVADDAVDDAGIDVLAADEKVCRLRDGVSRSASLAKPTPAMAKLRRTTRACRARAMTSIAVGAMSRRERSCSKSLSQTSTILGPCGAEVAGAGEHEVVGVGGQSMHERGGDATVFLDVGIESRELLEVFDEDGGRGADVEAHVATKRALGGEVARW